MVAAIRNLTAEDMPSVTAIYSQAVLEGTASYELVPPGVDEMTARFAAITGKGYPYLAALDGDNNLLGYAYASAFRTRPAYRWLVEDSIYVAEQARGLGVGKALLQALVQRCEGLGFRQMVGVVGGASDASVAVHRSCGFTLAGRLDGTGFKHGLWLDTIFMQRPLGEGNTTKPDLTVYPGTLG
ncbi:N-acetyltransferase family protein [Rhizobium sp. G187]|uniref:GNAT family N-acetyltransferase n=1 Tax=unclassified Rhizobium TaxID=2613769 RepID=UPI0006B9BA8B|nr:GNAT family N-acetyltransferase [Rhizobium sp. AAP43]KPF42868.1 GCN5 family acetyltransferase [Rhizobium sp. AAP43]